MAQKIALQFAWSTVNFHRYEADIPGSNRRWHIYIPRHAMRGLGVEPPKSFESYVGTKLKVDPEPVTPQRKPPIRRKVCVCGHSRGTHSKSGGWCNNGNCGCSLFKEKKRGR